MGGRPPVVGLLAVVAAVLLASLLAASPVCAQMRIPLFSDAKPKAVKKKPFRPTLPNRNPMRVTASVSADTVAPPKAENSEVSAVVGTSSTASVTVALANPRPGESDAATSSPESESSGSSDASDTETSQSDNPAAPQDVAVASSDAGTDSAPAADETASADSAEDSASDTTSGITSDDADDDAPAAETAEAPSVDEAAPAPEAQEQAPPAAEAEEAADQVADEPVAAPDEAEQTDDAAPAEAELTVDTAADATPSAPAEAAAAPPEDTPATTAATDTADETADETASPEPSTATPAETEQVTAAADASSADTVESAAAPSYDASVVLEVSPPPDKPKETQTAALTPPNAPVPDEATPPEDETPAAAEAEPDSDAADSDETAETPDEGAEKPAAAEETKPSDEGAEPATAEPAAAEPAEVALPPAHPIVAKIRDRLADPGFRKGIRAADLKALDEFYGTREGPPLWVTEAGFSDKAQAVIKEIGKADDWGLDASAFDLPPANDLLATPNAIVDDELQLSLAVLQYARYAQVGRLTPKQASPLFDQHPHQRNPKTVLTEIAAASAPDAYLTSLQPQHDQFKRLRQALLKARAAAKARGTKPSNDRDVQLIVMNMERWRWLPRSLGALYVWNNVPEFNTRVIKNGKTIYVEKTVVGQQKYATPLFSAPMRNIVFHPNWTVPPTIVNEDLAPKLQGSGGGFFSASKSAILARYGLKVNLKGEPVDPDTVDWKNVNVREYTFTQDPGPSNVLGKLKFNFPNRHAIYMHDTVQPELFDERVRSLSHGCIRVHDPDRFAALLLGQDKGWSMAQVRNQLAKTQTSVIGLNRRIPVHITYFTAVVDAYGNVNKLGDIYGIDNRMAAKMFTNPARFPVPAMPADLEVSNRDRNRSSGGGLDSIISGLFGN